VQLNNQNDQPNLVESRWNSSSDGGFLFLSSFVIYFSSFLAIYLWLQIDAANGVWLVRIFVVFWHLEINVVFGFLK